MENQTTISAPDQLRAAVPHGADAESYVLNQVYQLQLL